MSGSLTAFIEPGVYQRLDCGCVMFAVEFDPCGPCLCIVQNDGTCDRPPHSVNDFMPIRATAAQARAMARAS